MNLAIVSTRSELGIQAPAVTVEVHVAGGLPGLTIVGLPTAAVREAKDRVRAALQNSGFSLPARRITVNLAPADLPKDGGRFDLAIALGILVASGQLLAELAGYEFLGELSLSGALRPVQAVLPAVMAAALVGNRLVIPSDNAAEAAITAPKTVFQASHLLQVCAALQGRDDWLPVDRAVEPGPRPRRALDCADVQGQGRAKRALEIAATGRHNLLLIGPPGSGKSMLAQRLPGLCPELSASEALELASIQSTSRNGFDPQQWRQVPFRSPHHSASAAALVGGGSTPRPGEISLAHGGTLFLDELPEFSRVVLEVLREPLESGWIQISRVREQVRFPARFQLIAAMNPCPCGYLGDPQASCHCTQEQVQRYRSRISGPLLDRIDLHVTVPRLPAAELLRSPAQAAEPSARIRARVDQARARQLRRAGKCNADLDATELEQHCALQPTERALLQRAAEQLCLSGRGVHRVLKVARSIADLAGSTSVDSPHLAEALSFRPASTR